MKHDRETGFGTKAIHAGQSPDPSTGAIMTPVYMTSTYVQEEPAVTKGYDYSRSGNPTRAALEGNLAGLEGGKHGLGFASGMAAITCVMNLLKSGDHVIAGNDLYGGTYRLLKSVYEKFGIESTLIDMTDLTQLEAAFRPNTKLVMLETPTNPLLRCCAPSATTSAGGRIPTAATSAGSSPSVAASATAALAVRSRKRGAPPAGASSITCAATTRWSG